MGAASQVVGWTVGWLELEGKEGRGRWRGRGGRAALVPGGINGECAYKQRKYIFVTHEVWVACRHLTCVFS